MGVYHEDVNNRAKQYIDSFKSVGSYSDSKGAEIVRTSIASFIENRDGIPANKDTIFLANGASDAISLSMSLLDTGTDSGFMVPIPQYPLYSAEIALRGCQFVGYYLDEATGW